MAFVAVAAFVAPFREEESVVAMAASQLAAAAIQHRQPRQQQTFVAIAATIGPMVAVAAVDLGQALAVEALRHSGQVVGTREEASFQTVLMLAHAGNL